MSFFKSKNPNENSSEAQKAFLDVFENMPQISNYVLIDCLKLKGKIHTTANRHSKHLGARKNKYFAGFSAKGTSIYMKAADFVKEAKNNALCTKCSLTVNALTPIYNTSYEIHTAISQLLEIKQNLVQTKNRMPTLFTKEIVSYTADNLNEVFSFWKKMQIVYILFDLSMIGSSNFNKVLKSCGKNEQDYVKNMLKEIKETIQRCETILIHPNSKQTLGEELIKLSSTGGKNSEKAVLYGKVCYFSVIEEAFIVSQGAYRSKKEEDRLKGSLLQKYYKILEQLTFYKGYSPSAVNIINILLPVETCRELLSLCNWLKEIDVVNKSYVADLNLLVVNSDTTSEVLETAHVLWGSNGFSLKSYEQALTAAYTLSK